MTSPPGAVRSPPPAPTTESPSPSVSSVMSAEKIGGVGDPVEIRVSRLVTAVAQDHRRRSVPPTTRTVVDVDPVGAGDGCRDGLS